MILRTIACLFTLLICSSCSNETSRSINTLSIAAANDPQSLDPRLVRDLSSSTMMRMLYDGLMRASADGILPAIAENYTISEDQKIYTFHLRDAFWSDNSPVTAQDFIDTWKSTLSPSFPASNAYQLYVIKGAKEAKEGRIPIDSIGVKAPNSSTLIVELEQPNPYFLELVSCHFFYPVHETTRMHAENSINSPVVNGPFEVEQWTKRAEIKMKKNDHYWDQSHVALQKVFIQILDEHTALQLFKAGALDWVGSPLSTLPQDAIANLKAQNSLKVTPGAGTHWFRLNTSRFPFDNEQIRRAFALALNRQSIVEHVTQGNQKPAIGIIPSSLAIDQEYYKDNDIAEAKLLFDQVFKNAKFPSVTLSYASNDRNHKIAQAVQQQWNKAFDINLTLKSNEPQIQMEDVKLGNYDIGLGGWYSDIQDPINFLEVFKSVDSPTNQTFWQNDAYKDKLNFLSFESNPEKRQKISAEAEKILIDGMPVVPIFHAAYNYLHKEQVKGVYFSPLGYLDFKTATVE